MSTPGDSPYEKAVHAHKKWHIQAKELRHKFAVSTDQARQIVDSCSRCSQFPEPSRHVQIPERKHETATGPNEVISADCLHLNECNGYSYMMVTLDSYSRFARVARLKRLDSKSVYECLLTLFQQCGFPTTIKNDGAGYFVSAEMKGYMASHHTLIKTISVGRSNSNKVERLNRSIRAFLNRQGLKWSSPRVLYELNLYLNCSINIKKSETYGRLTPYELQNGFVPHHDRFLGIEKPEIYRHPVQSKVKFENFSSEMNKNVHHKKINKNRYSVGKQVFYRKYGRKSSQLMPATIVTVGQETCTLDNGHCKITRHFTDIIST